MWWLGSLSVASAATQQQLDEFQSGDESLADEPETDDDDGGDPPSETNNDNEQAAEAIIYARVSSRKQLDDDEETDGKGSIDDQVEQAKKIADRRSLALACDPIQDEARTGRNLERAGLRKVFYEAQRDEVAYLITQNVDRIGRSAAETLYFLHVLQNKCDVSLITFSGERDMSSVDGVMHTTLHALTAQVQNDLRTKKAQGSRVRKFLEQKNWLSGKHMVPVGYELTDDGWLKTNPETEDIVPELFQTFLECETYRGTKRRINDRHDDVLEGHGVKTLLQYSVYTGKPRLPESWVEDRPFENDLHEPELQLVDEDTFEEAQELIEQKNERHSTNADTKDVTDFVDEFGLFAVLASSPRVTLVHECGEPMVRDGQRTLRGDMTIHNYTCPECDESRRWPKNHEYELMELIRRVKEGTFDLLDFSD